MSLLTGCLLRIVAGIALMVIGLAGLQGTGGIILVIVGLIPLVAGLFNFCFCTFVRRAFLTQGY